MIKVEYSSNNSGGDWWLSDEDWFKLEAAGWTVRWYKNEPEGSMRRAGDGWLGALAKRAEKEFETPADAIREFETVTGQKASDEGCNCCGAPHSFQWTNARGEWSYASGESVLSYLYGNDQPTDLREALELLKRR
jgi:hypothetical protein